MYSGPAYEKVTGCKIDWKPGKDLTKKIIEKKQRKKKGKGAGEVSARVFASVCAVAQSIWSS